MTDGDIDDFIDALSLGDDLTFLYNGQKFFLRGYNQNGRATLYLDRLDPPADDYILVLAGRERQYPVQQFMDARIWDGKTFMEVQDEIQWVDD